MYPLKLNKMYVYLAAFPLILALCCPVIICKAASYPGAWSGGYLIEEYPPIITEYPLPYVLLDYSYNLNINVRKSDGNFYYNNEGVFNKKYNIYGYYYEYSVVLSDITASNNSYNVSVDVVSSEFKYNSLSDFYIEYSYGGNSYIVRDFDFIDETDVEYVYRFSFDVLDNPADEFDILFYAESKSEDYHDFLIQNIVLDTDAVTSSTDEYDNDTMQQATDRFNEKSDELHAVEEELFNSSSSYIEDYTETAFDISILDTLGSSLNFVVTWFTNFWNIGGEFTSILTLIFALSVVFYIVKVR